MEILDSGKDKVKKICDTLMKQTLDPAKQEAKAIVDQALHEAEKIIKQAKQEAKELVEEQKLKLLQEKKAFHSSLSIAGKQTLEQLKQQILHNLFNKELSKFFISETKKENVIASFIDVIIEAVKKEGLGAHFDVAISQSCSKQRVLEFLCKETEQFLTEKDLHLVKIGGGAKVKLKESNLTLEITDESLKELFSNYIRDDFRALLFQGKNQ